MFRVDRAVIWTFVAMYALLLPSLSMVKFLDEFFIYSLFIWVGADCVLNGRWRRYKILWIYMGVMSFYLLYSLTCVHFNTKVAVLTGWIIEMKPYLPLLVTICVKPRFTDGDRRLLRSLSLVVMSVTVVCMILWTYAIYFIFSHVAILGGVCILSATIFLISSINHDGTISPRSRLIVVIMLCIGLSCTRSKYYAEFLIYIFLIFLYKPGYLRHLHPRNAIMLIILAAIVVAAVIQKFIFYFGNGVDLRDFDINNVESFARMALYVGLVLVLIDFPLFGSGLSSFASYTSAYPYSTLYERYGLDKVWGLQPSMPDFVSDAYYASLAQFGLVGIAIFIYFWIWVYSGLRPLTRHGMKYKYYYVAGATIFIFVLVEMTTGTLVFHPPGECMTFLLGFVLVTGRALRHTKVTTDTLPSPDIKPKRIR